MRAPWHFRFGVTLVVLALVAAACGGGDDPTTTTSQTVTTTTGVATTDPALDPFHECEVGALTDRFLLAVDANVPAADVERNAEVEQFSLDGDRYSAPLSEQGIASLGEIVRYYVAPGAADELSPALDAIAELRDAGIDARPVYGYALQGHWTLEPGGEPPRVEGAGTFTPNAPVEPKEGDPMVGIVDGGFLMPEDLGYPDPGIEFLAGGIHGLFVANLIKRIEPAVGLRFSTAAIVEVNAFDPAANWVLDDGVVDAPVSDTGAVFDAILNVVGGDQSNPEINILNLSLGTYACTTDSGEALPPIEIEVLLDQLAQEGVEIVAAGGNETTVPGDLAFYPAAFSGVGGVGAHDVNLAPVTWDAGKRVAQQGASWDGSAPGIDVAGLFLSDGSAVVWSGSSFATAVTSGLIASGNQGAQDYGAIPGLCWFEGTDAFGDCP